MLSKNGSALILENLIIELNKLRYHIPNKSTISVLFEILQYARKEVLIEKLNQQIVIAIKDILNLTFEENEYANATLKISKEIYFTIKGEHLIQSSGQQKFDMNMIPRSFLIPDVNTEIGCNFIDPKILATEFPSLDTKYDTVILPELDATTSTTELPNIINNGNITLKCVQNLFDNIITKYRNKWADDQLLGYPNLDKNSINNIKNLLPKYEEFVIQTLNQQWLSFERFLQNIKDKKILEEILVPVYELLTKVHENIKENSFSSGLDFNIAKTNEEDENDDTKIVNSTVFIEKSIITNNNFDKINCTSIKDDLILSNLNDIEFPEIIEDHYKEFVSFPCFTKTNSNFSTNFLNTTKKDSKLIDIDEIKFGKENVLRSFEIEFKSGVINKPAEQLISISTNNKSYIDFSLIWNNNSRWTNMKYRLLQKGIIKLADLYVCLPINRNEFILSNGTFGSIEIGFTKSFDGIALRRLTEYGWSVDRCDDLLKKVEKLNKIQHLNLLRSFVVQDYCRHTFFYTKLCDYNLEEYIIKMKETKLLDSVAKRISFQIAKGLAALHKNNPAIIHGNLKPSNVFIDENGVVKLAEYGIYKICGILLHFVNSGGIHPYGRSNVEIVHNLEQRSPNLSVDSLDLWNLLTMMFHPDPPHRPGIIEVVNHVYFWSEEKKWDFLRICLSIANNEYEPISVTSTVSKKFCSILQESWSTDATKFFWMASAFIHFPGIEIPYGAWTDSGLGLLKFLNKCRHENPTLFNKAGWVLKAYPELPSLIYNALRGSNWFHRDDLKKFNPFSISNIIKS